MRVAKLILIVFTLSTFLLLIGCGGSAKIATFSVDEYTLNKQHERSLEKSNVTIEIEPLSPSRTYDYPELFSFDDQKLPDGFSGLNIMAYFPHDINRKSWCYTLGAGRKILTAFKVKITNKTPHILRMKDARIYLVIEGEDPIAAVTKLGNTQLYTLSDGQTVAPKSAIDGDESLVHWVTYFEKEFEQERPKGILSMSYPIGIASQVIAQHKSKYKLINDISKEILPDFTYEGILLFPALVSHNNIKLMFYDITTKTDAAGNPIEKTRFQFDLKRDTVDMWFDTVDKIWKIGLPPTTASNR